MAAEHDVVKFNRWIKSDNELVTPVLTATPRDQSTTESESVQETDQTERGITAVAEASVKPRTFTTVSLRPWIKQALHYVRDNANGKRAATSQEYLKAALKIAKSLTDQIVQAEESYNRSEISTKLDSLSYGQDLAEYVTVQLEEENNFDNLQDFDGLLSLPDNEELEAHLKSFEREEAATTANFTIDAPDINAESTSTCQSLERTDANEQKEMPSPTTRNINNLVLNIASAEIQYTGGKPDNRNGDTDNNSLRRIYQLGLVFYELLTGGEIPPKNLRAIALFTSAFVSLSTLTLGNNMSGDQTTFNDSSKRRQGKSSSGGGIGICESSCEYLRLIGIATPICNLILNMLNSVYGDLSGNESYTNMSDVAHDLQLMIDKPYKFLRGLDMDKLSVSGLPIHENEIHKKEFGALKSCYNRSITGSSEFAIIHGESGTGKSCLAYSLGKFVVSERGLFLTGKFDQMHHDQSMPFSALTSAFDQYCDLLLDLREKDSVTFKQIVDSLKAAFGQDAAPLFKIVPNLEIILGQKNKLSKRVGSHEIGQIDRNALIRLQDLICQFINVISTNSLVSVVLLLDDLQWIDETSLAILGTILKQRHRKFFFIGCCRDDEMKNNHAFWKMMDTVGALGVHATQVKLNCIPKQTLNGVVSDLLCLSPRLVKSLTSVLFSRTKGNVLFFLQLMLLLYRDGLLYIDFARQRWTWDEDEVASMKLPENIAICLTNGICKLPIEVQMALNILSLFGAAVKLSYLRLLESQLHMKILEPLKVAEAEGLVTNSNGSFHFSHDCIQEASLNLIEEQNRRVNHLAYGKCLVQRASATNDVSLLFTAVDQINLGGPAISEQQDYFEMANYNLTAGKTAMSMANFISALRYFTHGISFLRDGHWQDHYKFSLELYELACKSAFAARNITDLNVLSRQLLANARTFEDILEIEMIRMTLLAQSDSVEALKMGLTVVSKLGEELQSETKDAFNLEQVKAIVEGVSEEHILNYEIMNDTNKLMLMRFLSQIQPIAYHVKPVLNPSITLKMLQVTISHGELIAIFYRFVLING